MNILILKYINVRIIEVILGNLLSKYISGRKNKLVYCKLDADNYEEKLLALETLEKYAAPIYVSDEEDFDGSVYFCVSYEDIRSMVLEFHYLGLAILEQCLENENHKKYLYDLLIEYPAIQEAMYDPFLTEERDPELIEYIAYKPDYEITLIARIDQVRSKIYRKSKTREIDFE